MSVKCNKYGFVNTQQMSAAELTKLLRQQQHDLIVLSEVVLAVAAIAQVEQSEVDRSNHAVRIKRIGWRFIWWIFLIEDRRHVPRVARIADHEDDKAEKEDGKRQPCQSSLASCPLWHFKHLA